jgi:hypothetical protein
LIIFENVVPRRFKWWTGEYLKRDEDEDEAEGTRQEEDELEIPEGDWIQIGNDMVKSRKMIPGSYGRALRNIYKYHNSFKAEEWLFLLYYSPVLLH